MTKISDKQQIMLRLNDNESDVLSEMKKFMNESVSTKAIMKAITDYKSNEEFIQSQTIEINQLKERVNKLESLQHNFINSLNDMMDFKQEFRNS